VGHYYYFQLKHCSFQGLLCDLGYTFQLSPPGVSTRVTTRVTTREHPAAEGGTVRKFCLNADFHVTFRDLLHTVKLRHGTDGFTSPPNEGVPRIFFRPKNSTASAGCEPANLGTKDHRSRFVGHYVMTSYLGSNILRDLKVHPRSCNVESLKSEEIP